MDFNPRGIIPVLVIPLQADETLDEGALHPLIDHATAGGVPVYTSTGSNTTQETVDLSRAAEAAASATSATAPTFVRPSQAETALSLPNRGRRVARWAGCPSGTCDPVRDSL